LESEFARSFIRIHRNALVAKKYLSGFSKDKKGRWKVSFRGIDKQLEVSRRHTADVRKIVKQL